MRKLLTNVLIFCFFITSILGIVVILGRSQTLPTRIQQLHLAACTAPCWMGIVPGQTPFGEVNKQFAEMIRKGFTLGASEDDIYKGLPVGDPNNPTDRLPILFGIDQQTKIVRSINIPHLPNDHGKFNKFMPSLGETAILFGPPSCVFFTNRNYGGLIYISPKGTILVWLSEPNSLRLTQTVQSIQMDEPGFAYCRVVSPSNQNWRGFTGNVQLYK